MNSLRIKWKEEATTACNAKAATLGLWYIRSKFNEEHPGRKKALEKLE